MKLFSKTIVLSMLLSQSMVHAATVTNAEKKQAILQEVSRQIENSEMDCRVLKGKPEQDLLKGLKTGLVLDLASRDIKVETNRSIENRVNLSYSEGNQIGDAQANISITSRQNSKIDSMKIKYSTLKQMLVNKGTLTDPELVQDVVEATDFILLCDLK